MNESITAELLIALDIVVMEQVDDGFFRIIGNVPDWFLHFYPDAVLQRDRLRLGQSFSFLENFFIDAQYFWTENRAGKLRSGAWSEIDTLGDECYLEASAVCLENKRILLISFGEIADHQEKRFLIQKGRETSLTYQYLIKEIQKKEILIHCIVHDLAGELTPINHCFELLGLQNLTSKGKEYLEIGKKQSIKLEKLIREILDAFSAEVESLDNFTFDPTEAPSAIVCAREVVNALLPTFLLNEVNLQLNPNTNVLGDYKVVGEKLRLDRVLFNLVENAFRHSPPFSTVTVGIEEDDKFILFTIDDEGSGVTQDISNTLFQKFSQGKYNSGRVGLGLYFCRITIERWGGTIGCINRSEGGSRFWFRLPKVAKLEY